MPPLAQVSQQAVSRPNHMTTRVLQTLPALSLPLQLPSLPVQHCAITALGCQYLPETSECQPKPRVAMVPSGQRVLLLQVEQHSAPTDECSTFHVLLLQGVGDHVPLLLTLGYTEGGNEVQKIKRGGGAWNSYHTQPASGAKLLSNAVAANVGSQLPLIVADLSTTAPKGQTRRS